MTHEPKIRELRVTDIRCHADGCGVGPGMPCRGRFMSTAIVVTPHPARIEEHAELVAAGWQWQEIDATDKGRT